MKQIVLTPADHQRLVGIIKAMRANGRLKAAHLLTMQSELQNARLVPEESIPADVVTIGSRVSAVNLTTNEEFTYTIVFPAEADSVGERISVLAPLGAALIGERAGTTTACNAPCGIVPYRIDRVERA